MAPDVTFESELVQPSGVDGIYPPVSNAKSPLRPSSANSCWLPLTNRLPFVSLLVATSVLCKQN